jgi:hypothetical protein
VPAGDQGLSAGTQQFPVTTAAGLATPAAVLGLRSQRDGLDDGIPAVGLSWRLPGNASCARTARAHIRQVFGDLQMPGELIDDAAVAVSELVTNAWLHALDAKPLATTAGPGAAAPELWVYRRGEPPDAEAVCGVFDTRRDIWPRARQEWSALLAADTQLADPQLDGRLAGAAGNGHGLGIVAALSGTAGWHRTRSRSGDRPVPGKVTWFTMPIPDGSAAARPPSVRLAPDQAAHALTALLTGRGIPGAACRHDTTHSAVSVTADLTIWCHQGAFQWKSGNGLDRRSYSDLADTVEAVVRLHEDTAYARTSAHVTEQPGAADPGPP